MKVVKQARPAGQEVAGSQRGNNMAIEIFIKKKLISDQQ
jgi:hypothetical protein